MKTYTFLLICIAIALTFACSSSQSLNSLKKPDELVLEVITTAYGAAYPKEGEIINMRLFESGRFEYDDFPELNPPHTRNVIVTKKEAKLNPEDVKELIVLAEQPDFLSAKEKYSSWDNQHTDTFWDITIKFIRNGQQKKIAAEDFWTMVDSKEAKSVYPPSMINLIERVEELKAKTIGKSFKQWAVSSNKS